MFSEKKIPTQFYVNCEKNLFNTRGTPSDEQKGAPMWENLLLKYILAKDASLFFFPVPFDFGV